MFFNIDEFVKSLELMAKKVRRMNYFLKLFLLNPRLTAFIAVIAFSICVNGAAVCIGDDSPVAIGEGIAVTKDDVQRLAKHMKEHSFSSTYEQHLKAALRFALFAKEASALGLDAGGDNISSGEDSVKTRIVLARRYIDKLLSEYPVSDLVIESYYLSHPMEFPKTDKQEQIPYKGNEDIARDKIREKIREVKRSEVAAKAFESLKKKYKVRIVGGAG